MVEQRHYTCERPSVPHALCQVCAQRLFLALPPPVFSSDESILHSICVHTMPTWSILRNRCLYSPAWDQDFLLAGTSHHQAKAFQDPFKSQKRLLSTIGPGGPGDPPCGQGETTGSPEPSPSKAPPRNQEIPQIIHSPIPETPGRLARRPGTRSRRPIRRRHQTTGSKRLPWRPIGRRRNLSPPSRCCVDHLRPVTRSAVPAAHPSSGLSRTESRGHPDIRAAPRRLTILRCAERPDCRLSFAAPDNRMAGGLWAECLWPAERPLLVRSVR